MKVLVVGAGIIGVCTAWYLCEHGFEVVVLERRDDVARETSAGNAGVIAPGYVTPWAAPGMPGKILSYLLSSAAPVRFRPTADRRQWRWIARWLRECRLERYRVNRLRMQRIAFYSRDELHELRASLGIDYHRSRGYLQLFRSERDLAMAAPARALLEEQAIPHRVLDADGCRAQEPALAAATPLAGGLYLPDDESGDCLEFARALRHAAEACGVDFRFGRQARAILVDGGRVAGVQMNDGERIGATSVVVAAGPESGRLLRPAGIDLPIYPVKGYSATVPLNDAEAGPRQALMDEAYKTAVTPLGDRLRVSGTAEVGDAGLKPRQAALRTLLKVGRDWFPDAARWDEATFWTGARPMLPDGPPVLGATPLPGLFLNLGHGSTGWAMACGSGRVVADVVAGKQPAIDLDGLTLARYR
ncbi:MAG TPA: D-amino acid dehydrogenase [Burkholderiaceae bacterium]|nr:D-amino acid dehydrogenase [Burkholderiaceae bacterium]